MPTSEVTKPPWPNPETRCRNDFWGDFRPRLAGDAPGPRTATPPFLGGRWRGTSWCRIFRSGKWVRFREAPQGPWLSCRGTGRSSLGGTDLGGAATRGCHPYRTFRGRSPGRFFGTRRTPERTSRGEIPLRKWRCPR